jgi:hypothetical protein
VKLYLDTSVLGAVFDAEPVGRKETTQLFFQTVRARLDALYISDLVLDEIDRAPDRVRFSLLSLLRRVRPKETFGSFREHSIRISPDRPGFSRGGPL